MKASCDRCKYSRDIDNMPRYKKRDAWANIYCTKKKQVKHYSTWDFCEKCFVEIEKKPKGESTEWKRQSKRNILRAIGKKLKG